MCGSNAVDKELWYYPIET